MTYDKLITKRSEKKYYPDFQSRTSSRRWYQHDIDTIIYSEMFRKMQRKAQLLSIYDPVSRSRLIHTFEVVRIAKEISEKLGLSAELTEAIALAHDFGNVAYGKIAEIFLQEKTDGLFKHEEVSALMLKVSASRCIPDKYWDKAKKATDTDRTKLHTIEISDFPNTIETFLYNDRIYYICMSPEILDGVLKHGTDERAMTLEGQVVNYADNIAYLIQDVSDFEATGIFNEATKKRYQRSLDGIKDTKKAYPISGIVAQTTSMRTATLIERFVSHNKKRLKDNTCEKMYSSIFNQDIPILESEEVVKKAIDACWKFKEDYYDNCLIKLSNMTSKTKMKQIWDILENDSHFVKNNNSYMEFERMTSSPIFVSFREQKGIKSDKDWANWKKAFFIAHLTCDEIDLIIKSFLERDYVFDLSLPQFK